MRVKKGVLLAAACSTLLAAPAVAQEHRIQRTRNPRLVGTAVMINLVYVPARLALIAVGGVLGGLAGFITLGDRAAAESIWGLTDGSAVITPEMLEGTEEFHFSAYD